MFALWDEPADFAVGDGEAAVGHLLSRLCAIFGAQNALGSVVVCLPGPDSRDPWNGWRPRIVRLLKPLAQVAESVQEQFDALWSQSLDISQILAMAGDEAFRTRLLLRSLSASPCAGCAGSTGNRFSATDC